MLLTTASGICASSLSRKPKKQKDTQKGHEDIESLSRRDAHQVRGVLTKDIHKDSEESVPENKMCRQHAGRRPCFPNQQKKSKNEKVFCAVIKDYWMAKAWGVWKLY